MKGYSLLGGKVIHVDFSALQKKKPPLPAKFQTTPEVEAVFAQRLDARQATIIPPPSPPCKCWDCTTGPMQVTGPKYGTTALLILTFVTAIVGWSAIIWVFAKLVLG
jgi:hypothetical protein